MVGLPMCNYTIITLKSFAVSKLQVAILVRLSREMYQTVGIDSSHEFASQFGLAIFYTRKTHKRYREDRVPRKFQFLLHNWQIMPSGTSRQVFVECAGHGLSIASDNMSGNNSDHSGERLNQNGDNVVYTFTT